VRRRCIKCVASYTKSGNRAIPLPQSGQGRRCRTSAGGQRLLRGSHSGTITAWNWPVSVPPTDRPVALHLRLLRHFESVVDLDPKVTDRAFQVGVPEQQLDGANILRAPVDQRRLGAPQRVRPRSWLNATAGLIERCPPTRSAISSGRSLIGSPDLRPPGMLRSRTESMRSSSRQSRTSAVIPTSSGRSCAIPKRKTGSKTR
jgi:hypothetical protein